MKKGRKDGQQKRVTWARRRAMKGRGYVGACEGKERVSEEYLDGHGQTAREGMGM